MTEQTATEPSLRDRIELAYQRDTGRNYAHGAMAWFARKAKVHPQTVSTWVNDHTPIAGPALGLLEEIERGQKGGANG